LVKERDIGLGAFILNTETKILKEAIEIFRRNGYHSTSTKMVSEHCRISKGNLTYHYRTKEELFRACLETSAKYFKKYVLLKSFSDNSNELDGLIDFLRSVKKWLITDNKVTGCFFSNSALELRHTNPELADFALGFLREYKLILQEKIRSGQQKGFITSRESAELLLEELFIGYEGAMIYSRIENHFSCFDFFIERTYKYFLPGKLAAILNSQD